MRELRRDDLRKRRRVKFVSRLQLALDVLCGHVKVEDGAVKCGREHVGPGEVRVKANDYKSLLAGNTELGILRGAVATLETPKYEQVRKAAHETLANLQKE